MKKALFAIVVLSAVMLMGCPPEPVIVNVRILNNTGSIIGSDCRIGTVVFDFLHSHLANGQYSSYKEIEPGTYRLEFDDVGWVFIGDQFSLSESGNYTVRFNGDSTTTLIKD